MKGSKTAFLWNMDNLVDIENHRHHQGFDAWQYVYTYYNALKRLGCPVTFLQEEDAFDVNEYPFMVVPAYQIASKALIKKLQQYAENGGNLILSSRTAKKDPNGHIWKAHNQEPIWDLIGASIPEFDHLPAQNPGKVQFSGKDYTWYRWGDWLEPQAGTESLATYGDQFYKGTSAITRRKTNKGSVTYIGVWSNDGEMEKDVLNKIFVEAGVQVLDLPSYVFTEWRDGYWITVNYSSSEAIAPLKNDSKILFGNKTVQPGGVSVWINK
ncbi:MAG: beta-galactosidase trimerization domain-containing protein [Cyclobacteriaceae bacterium]